MKKQLFLLMIIFTSALSAQVISIADGSSIDISAEASVNIAGLELSPSANFTIVGENSISKESDVITIEGSAQVLNSPNESMSKNYMAGVSLEGYTGSVKFNYSDDEMNGVTHNASLYVMNSNSVWTEYKDEDSDDNSITYDFINPLEIKTVTAGIQTYNVTFSVNTANITVGENGMYLGGGIIGPANAYAMSDDDGDGVWTVTISMGEGTTGNYIFLNSPANGEDWGAKENLTGQECADGEYDDRLLAEVTSDTTLLHCFGSCESDGTCPATTEVTFNVDMSQYGLMDGDTVHVNGEFTGWCGSCGNEMSDDDGDGVYSITFDLEPGSYFWKYTVNGWDDQESFSDAVDGCTANNNGNFDRQVVVTDEAQELTYCWNSCDSACAVSYDCDYTISVTDSYGDGWNDNSVELFANGTSIGSFANTADAGAGVAQTTAFGINEGDVITSEWTLGGYPTETSYTISDSYGNIVFSVVNGTTDDVALTATCIEVVSYDCDYTISVTDSYGDGWNDNSVELFANGTSIGSFANTADAGAGVAQTTAFGINEGDVITSEWTLGGYPTETSYTISDSYGNIVFSVVNGTTADVALTATCIEDLDPAMTASVVVDGADAIFTIATENFVIGDTDADGHWHYSLNGGEDVMVYTTELTLTDLPNGDHSILIWLVDSSHNPLDPPVEQTIEFSTFNGLADCDETVVYTQVANGDYSVSLSSGDDLLASVTINATMEANWDSIIVTDGAGNQLNTQIDGEFVNADFYSTDGTISVNVLNDGSIQNGDVTLVFACVALSIDESDISGIRVYPNPSSSIVYIDSSEDLEITLYSLLGQQILKTNSKTIDISSLNDGIYLIVAKDSNNKITNFKLMKK